MQTQQSNMFKNGLLILASPVHQLSQNLGDIISRAVRLVNYTLYVHLAPGVHLPNQDTAPPVPLIKSTHHIVQQVYIHGSNAKPSLDVRFLLHNIGKCTLPGRESSVCPYDVVISEMASTESAKRQLLQYCGHHFPDSNTDGGIECMGLGNISAQTMKDPQSEEEIKTYDNVVLGGTFDRLHAGHKILLSQACLLTNKSLTIGVTDGAMNKKKTLNELILPVGDRISALTEFLKDTKPGIHYNIVPITDPFGPSIVDPDLQCIVVSKETLKGGQMVNEKRQEKGLSTLEVDVIDLVEDVHHSPHEEAKISSSSQRQRILGTLIQPPQIKSHLAPKPFVIGLTGGIASGKSSICRRLEKLGAVVVDCDKLGHAAYAKGSSTLEKLVAAFGSGVLLETGEVNRKALGAIVFSDKAQLERLNQIVWPEIRRMAKEKTEALYKEGHSIVILDAAVLLEAGWDNDCHEVWLALIPQNEAVKRIMDRNKLSEEAAVQRVEAQLTNQERISHANVVFSTLWEPEVTQAQVEKAWQLLNQRMESKTKL